MVLCEKVVAEVGRIYSLYLTCKIFIVKWGINYHGSACKRFTGAYSEKYPQATRRLPGSSEFDHVLDCLPRNICYVWEHSCVRTLLSVLFESLRYWLYLASNSSWHILGRIPCQYMKDHSLLRTVYSEALSPILMNTWVVSLIFCYRKQNKTPQWAPLYKSCFTQVPGHL